MSQFFFTSFNSFDHKLIIVFLLILNSCSGYRVVNTQNPFSEYGISSISIPTFVSYAAVPGLSAPMSKEVFLMLSKYSGLDITVNKTAKTDAVVLGVITTARSRENAISSEAQAFTGNSIGDRQKFYVSSKSKLDIVVRLVLIKNPNF